MEAYVTIGIKPTISEIGYGYIKYKEGQNYITYRRIKKYKEY